jgi:hypothetical protein
LGIIAVEILFYLSLTLMLGAFFNQRGPVLAIPLALVFLQQLFWLHCTILALSMCDSFNYMSEQLRFVK